MAAARPKELTAYVAGAFASHARGGILVLPLFIVVNAVVLYNAVVHPPNIGYDAGHHLRYLAALSEFRLPRPADTPEFFSPPLAYFVGALAMAVTDMTLAQAAKFAQLTQVVVSVMLTFYLLKLCDLLRPGDSAFKLAALGLCALPAVYYKTFSQTRGEPWLALLAVLMAYHTLTAVSHRNRPWRDGIVSGVLGAMAILSRQWGVFLLVGVGLFVALVVLRRPELRVRVLKIAAVSAVIIVLGGGWFYLVLRERYGSFTSFNRESLTLQSTQSARQFYLGNGNGKLFTEPVRPAFPNELMPIFYSELWGDYWAFFLVYGRDLERNRCLNGPRLERMLWREASRVATNRASMGAYLGRVNLAGIIPTLLLLAGFVIGGRALARVTVGTAADDRTLGLALAFAVVGISVLGYLWFVTKYQSQSGNTIKATYLLQVVPLLALLGAERLVALRSGLKRALAFLLILVAIHNAPTTYTRYAPWGGNVCGGGRNLPAAPAQQALELTGS